MQLSAEQSNSDPRAELRDLLKSHPDLAPSFIDPNQHYRVAQVAAFAGVSTSNLYAMVYRGSFAQPLRRGSRLVYWPGAVVIAELERLAIEDAESAK